MEKYQENIIKRLIKRLGLPENEIMENLNKLDDVSLDKAILELETKYQIKVMGLPEDTSVEELEKIYDERRRKKAIELGLDENATYKEIYFCMDKLGRQQEARKLGLPDDSSWDDIDNALGISIPSYEEYLEKQEQSPKNR